MKRLKNRILATAFSLALGLGVSACDQGGGGAGDTGGRDRPGSATKSDRPGPGATGGSRDMQQPGGPGGTQGSGTPAERPPASPQQQGR